MLVLKAGALYFAIVFGAGFLLVAEFTLVLRLRGQSVTEYFANRDPVPGAVYYLMLGAFAIMPLLVDRK
jgi:hypothetical protein